ncbi:caspase family protein [Streptomyces sp. NBC_00820]|uniref:caspase family protein n=1 Tax=Streptomyces sp. NBC_00820 TaxID=2975842 RepID=UPI002ED41071|nr:caspase family protein [Streptomyces sp. NBC_00820]
MRSVYALFVGIDDYPEKPLKGCVNDVREAEQWLRRQGGVRADVLPLHNGRATRAAVLGGIERHLGRSGPGDTALLWFSGHGSEEATDAPWEATGRSQALVCHDSQTPGGQPLRDTELGALLDGIAARGAHVVAVLDCCHSGGATRDETAGVRSVTWRPWWHTDGARGTRDTGGQGPEQHRHVLLAACRPQELAHEEVLDGRVRGYFSHALLATLGALGPAAAHGALHARVEERVRRLSSVQHPELRGPENGSFLYGDTLEASPFLLRHTADGWEVNCGRAHGLATVGAEFTLLGGAGTPRTVVVRALRAESALVEPTGWQPGPADRESVFGVTPSVLAFTRAAVTLEGEPAAVRLLADALVDRPLLAAEGDGPTLRVEAADGRVRVSGGGGVEPELPLRSRADAARVADCLEHLTRWRHIRDLDNPDPWLSSLVRVTVEETSVGGVRHTADGEVICSYTDDHRSPQVMVGIRNDSDRPLWCVLLDLTDRYGSWPGLFEGEFVGPGHTGWARRGEPVWLFLPSGREVRRGAYTREWLKLIVAENELNLAPFRLDPWSADAPEPARGLPTGSGSDGGLLRLAAPAHGRDAGGPQGRGVGRWGTVKVLIRTEVP